MQAEHMKCERFELTIAEEIRGTGRTNKLDRMGTCSIFKIR